MVLPGILGSPFVTEEDREPYGALFSWCIGWAVLFALFFPLGVVCNLVHTSLTFLTGLYSAVLAAAVIAAVWIAVRRAGGSAGNNFIAFFRGITFPEIVSALLIFAHAAVTFLYMHIDDDDATYVATATTTLDTNTLMKFYGLNGKQLYNYLKFETHKLVVAPQYAFYAYLSKITGIRPAPLCHSFLPPVLTILFFSVYLLIAVRIFGKDRRKCGTFMLFVYVAAVFSSFSTYTSGMFMLVRSWQGKGVSAGYVIPMVLYVFLTIWQHGRKSAEGAGPVSAAAPQAQVEQYAGEEASRQTRAAAVPQPQAEQSPGEKPLRQTRAAAAPQARASQSAAALSDYGLLLIVLMAGCLQTIMGASLASLMAGGLAVVTACALRKPKVFLASLVPLMVPAGQILLYFILKKKWITP